jgi:hypothetical protein
MSAKKKTRAAKSVVRATWSGSVIAIANGTGVARRLVVQVACPVFTVLPHMGEASPGPALEFLAGRGFLD